MFAVSARMCAVRAQATVCFPPWGRRKSGTAASSAYGERIAPGSRPAGSGSGGGTASGGGSASLESGLRASRRSGRTNMDFGSPWGSV